MKINEKISKEVMVMSIIKKLVGIVKESTNGERTGFHSVYGFKVGEQRVEFFKNTCKKLELTSAELITILKALAEAKKIYQFPVKGGYFLVLPEDIKTKTPAVKATKSFDIFEEAIS